MSDLIQLITLEWKEFMDFVEPLFYLLTLLFLKLSNKKTANLLVICRFSNCYIIDLSQSNTSFANFDVSKSFGRTKVILLHSLMKLS